MEYCAKMTSGENKLIRRRLVGAWLSTVISISLVLLLVGVAGLLVANAKSVSDYFKENMQISVLMKQEVGEDEVMEYVSELDAMPFIKSTKLISREQGTREMADLLGEDFLDVFETAPIPVSVDVTLKADYVSSDSLIVWIVNRRENTLSLTVLLIRTNEMNSNRTMNTPSTADIFPRFVFSLSTRDC